MGVCGFARFILPLSSREGKRVCAKEGRFLAAVPASDFQLLTSSLRLTPSGCLGQPVHLASLLQRSIRVMRFERLLTLILTSRFSF
jgi:hypothetical protein